VIGEWKIALADIQKLIDSAKGALPERPGQKGTKQREIE